MLLRDRTVPTTTTADSPPVDSSAVQDSPEDSESVTPVENQINAIVAAARQGKLTTAPFVVGKTKKTTVEDVWDFPDQTTDNGGSTFVEYPSRFATIGYRDEIAMDLRTDAESLRDIHYRDILDTLGEAQDVSTYSDDTVDQIILSYDVSDEYTLRWILPKPWSGEDDAADTSENPELDHISLISTDSPASTNEDASTQTPGEEPATTTPASEPSASSSESDTLVSNMTLDQKIGQMVIAGVKGTSLATEDRNLLRDYGVGGVILYGNNIDSASQTSAFVKEIKAANPNPELPLFVSVDQEGGRVARLKGVESIPTAAKIGERNDEAYARQIGEQLGDQLLSQGFNLDYAPVLDVNSNPDNPVIGDRSFGNNADLVSKLGIAVMQGLESKKVIPVVKHFPGHGDTSVDSHIALPVVNKDLNQLNKLELIPFKKAINSGADMVMIAHILLPKLDKTYPSSLSKAIITDLLRDQLGFEGVVITDDLTMGAITENYGLGEASVHAVQAGSDILLVAHEADNAIAAIEAVKKAVQDGKISEEQINQSVERIIALKQKTE
nr:beta-N-acetylhexosaminidase [Saccharibacillus sp. JS10]